MSSRTESKVSLANSVISCGEPIKKQFFSKEFKHERFWMYSFTTKSILMIGVGIFCVLPFYWGSLYQREGRTGNIRILVYNQDQSLIGNTLVDVLPSNTLGWDVISDNSTVSEITHRIFEEDAWAAIVVVENATSKLQNALETADASFNSSGLIQLIFEKQRDLYTNSYIQPWFDEVSGLFDAQFGNQVIKPLVGNLSESQKSDLISNAPNILASSMAFQFVNLSVYQPQILAAVLQIGLLHIIIIAFFQIGFFVELHQRISVQLKFKTVVVYRITLSAVCYFFVSLFTCLVSLAFRVEFSNAFGKAGFVIFWMITYVTMVAVGMASENVGLILAGIYPPLLGIWLLLWVIINISPTFSPFELCPPVFKYGYAMPLYNAFELSRIVIVNSTRRNMGRYFGILLAWVVLDIILMPLCFKFYQYRMRRDMVKQRLLCQTLEQREMEMNAMRQTIIA